MSNGNETRDFIKLDTMSSSLNPPKDYAVTIIKQNIGDQEVNSVSARDLYLDLGMSANNWTRWHEENIVRNEFFKQDIDFAQLLIKRSANNPNPPTDFAITIEFAKHIAMMAKTQRAHDYRNYFIECESIAKGKAQKFEQAQVKRLPMGTLRPSSFKYSSPQERLLMTTAKFGLWRKMLQLLWVMKFQKMQLEITATRRH